MMPLLMEIACVPGVAVTLPPVQVVLGDGDGGTGAITTPLLRVPGKVSVRLTLSSWRVFVLVSVIVSVEMPSGLTVVGAKALETDRPLTVKSAEKLPGTFRFSVSEMFAGEIVLV